MHRLGSSNPPSWIHGTVAGAAGAGPDKRDAHQGGQLVEVGPKNWGMGPAATANRNVTIDSRETPFSVVTPEGFRRNPALVDVFWNGVVRMFDTTSFRPLIYKVSGGSVNTPSGREAKLTSRVPKRYTLSSAQDALAALNNRKAYGKVVVMVGKVSQG